MNDIIRLLPKLLDAAGDNNEFAESVARVAWTRAIGEGLRLHALPLRLSGNTLVVAVADALWQKQLRAMSEELLARVNRVLGRNMIDFIEFQVDPNRLEAVSGEHAESNKPRFSEKALAGLPAEIRIAAEEIRDESLRQHFLSAAAAGTAREAGE